MTVAPAMYLAQRTRDGALVYDKIIEPGTLKKVHRSLNIDPALWQRIQRAAQARRTSCNRVVELALEDSIPWDSGNAVGSP